MDHSHSASDDPRKPLLGATVAAGVGGANGLNHDTAKENNSSSVNNLSYGASTSPSQQSITRGDEEEDEEVQVLLEAEEQNDTAMDSISRKSQWILLAVASGACAAFNGVFAKLYVAFSLLICFCACIAGFGGLLYGCPSTFSAIMKGVTACSSASCAYASFRCCCKPSGSNGVTVLCHLLN
jgi:hypothetical protein